MKSSHLKSNYFKKIHLFLNDGVNRDPVAFLVILYVLAHVQGNKKVKLNLSCFFYNKLNVLPKTVLVMLKYPFLSYYHSYLLSYRTCLQHNMLL